MNVRRSLRSRLFWGSLIGASGMLMLGHIFFLHFIRYFPHVFRLQHASLATLIAVVLVSLGVLQGRKGLSAFDHLRSQLASVRQGKDVRIEGQYPSEVQPLVNDLNSLLEHRHEAVMRAQAKAGDLAHGLKTPLAILAHEAQRAREAGYEEIAENINHQVERMRKHVHYHLAHARAAASGAAVGAHCTLAESADGLIRTLRRLYADRGITMNTAIQREYAVRVEREDVDEMLGNLLDNACKWTKDRVDMAAFEEGPDVLITVDDNGPGLERDKRELVLQRGVRADETAPGSGLGLAIVRDLAELHGGSIRLEESPLGGLRAMLRLPRG